jgi:hypothetical protein
MVAMKPSQFPQQSSSDKVISPFEIKLKIEQK